MDLTKPAPESQAVMGLGGGVSSSDTRQALGLPLALALRLERPDSIPRHGTFQVELEITNIGATVFRLPASRDYDLLHRDESHGLRLANLALVVSKDIGEETQSVTEMVAVLCGAASAPESFVRIEPGETIVVRVDAQIGRLRYIPAGKMLLGEDEVSVGAAYWEYTVQEERFAIREQSEQVRSDSKTVRWR